MASETRVNAQSDLATRVTAIESSRDAERPHLATKADIAELKALMERQARQQIMWIVATGVALFAAIRFL